MSAKPGRSKIVCALCESLEDSCGCEKYCVYCQSQLDVCLCTDGLYYCEACRKACDYKAAN